MKDEHTQVDYNALISAMEWQGDQDWSDAIEIGTDLDEYMEQGEYS